MKKKLIICLIAITIVSVQCRKENVDIVDCSGITPTYTKDIKPIMDANCATSGCHDAGSKKDGYDLSDAAGTIAGAGKSEFLGSIQHKKGYKKMPDNKPQLSKEERDKIACWVQNDRPE